MGKLREALWAIHERLAGEKNIIADLRFIHSFPVLVTHCDNTQFKSGIKFKDLNPTTGGNQTVLDFNFRGAHVVHLFIEQPGNWSINIPHFCKNNTFQQEN